MKITFRGKEYLFYIIFTGEKQSKVLGTHQEIMVPSFTIATSLCKVVAENKNSLLEGISNTLLCVLDCKTWPVPCPPLLCGAASDQHPGLQTHRALSGQTETEPQLVEDWVSSNLSGSAHFLPREMCSTCIRHIHSDMSSQCQTGR